MSELQAEEVNDGITFSDEESETGQDTVEAGEELATSSPEGQDEENGAEPNQNQDAVQKAINKQHAKYREEERKRKAVEAERDALQKQLDEIKAKSGEIKIPPLPDPYDEDYEQRIAEREEAIKAKAKADHQSQLIEEQKQAKAKAAEEAEAERIGGMVEEYRKRGVQAGLDPREIDKAGEALVDFGVDPDTALFLLEDDDGPMIAKYLADNLSELDELLSVSPARRAIRIHTDIRGKAVKTVKTKATAAPDPVERPTGKGAPDRDSPLISGATFE